jgi:hypothetical protein
MPTTNGTCARVLIEVNALTWGLDLDDAVLVKATARRSVEMKRAVLLATLLVPTIGSPADNDGNYKAITVRDAMGSCGAYLNARDRGHNLKYDQINVYTAWMLGYLTAYNRLTPDTYDITGGENVNALMLWLENHCKKDPFETFASAMRLLTEELYPKRTSKQPKQP